MLTKKHIKELMEAEYCSLTKREIYALWMMLNFHIHRYCMDIVRHENIGQHHWIMSDILAAFITLQGGDYLMRGSSTSYYAKILVHEWLAEELTGYLDEKIGLPLTDFDEQIQRHRYVDYDLYAERFFDYIIMNWDRLKYYVESNNDELIEE